MRKSSELAYLSSNGAKHGPSRMNAVKPLGDQVKRVSESLKSIKGGKIV